jgi:flavin reductase (DIM6/NTAB) family NADH-FMN oxidoreductase RutF
MSLSAAKSSSTELDDRTLRDAFGRFATGVAFVTAEVAGTPHGLIVSSFAAPGADRFTEPLEGALAVIECELEAEHPAGDHWIVVGRVTRLQLSADTDPLVYFAGDFGAFHTD